MFIVRLNERPFYKESVDGLIIRLSKIFETVRTGGSYMEGDANLSALMQQEKDKRQFVRHTAKYWVHPGT
jgi:SPX domain protein involved in polyphosphate accumulation